MPVRSPARPRSSAASGERLQKVLAAAGIGSRRACESLILEGRVQVERKVIRRLGTRVDIKEQEIHVDGELLLDKKKVYYALNKPSGFVCSSRDPDGRPRAIDLLPPSAGRLFTVGRLDMSSEGLILVTNDGELANRLTHPRYSVEKTYHVTVAGHPTAEVVEELRRGVHLAEGFARVVQVRIKSRRKKSTLLEIVLDEGRNREVRRLLARVGHKVLTLVRIAIGPLRLGEMPDGSYRPLTQRELSALRVATGEKSGGSRSKRPTNRQGGSSQTRRPSKKRATGKGTTGRGAADKGKRTRGRQGKG